MGSDGANGAEAIHLAGGTVFAQDEATALYNAMPAAAIATGAVDRVLSPPEIAEGIVERTALSA
jgi:chemotaxis response regulator CheB